MVSVIKISDRFWRAVPRSGWFELRGGDSCGAGFLHFIFSIVVVLMWNSARYSSYKGQISVTDEWNVWTVANLCFMTIFYICSLLVVAGIMTNGKALLIPALVSFPLTGLFIAAQFFSGIYNQTEG